MRLSERSFPHPVIGNRDDVPGASFQSTIAVSFDAETTFIDVTVANSSSVLNDLVANDRACYILHLECSNTLYRSLHKSRQPEFRISAPKSFLNSTVEVNVAAIAADNISGYSVDGQHEEYGAHTFEITKGDVLAIYPGQQFTIDRDYMSFQHIDSIVTIIPFADNVDRPMSISCEGDKIVVQLCKSDFAEYATVRNSPLAPILASTIVLPVIAEAVRILMLKDSEDQDLRWCRAIRKRLTELQAPLNDEPLLLAQKLLELPIKRALSAAVTTQTVD